MKRESVIGNIYGRLMIIKELPDVKNYRRVLCKCECGNLKEVSLPLLKNRDIKSCGCLRRELNFKHNLTNHPLYVIWAGMKARCENKSHFGYPYYGKRGICVCEDWHEFIKFYQWAILTYRKGLEIDRINVNGNYEPSNCRWVTKKENARNRRNTFYIEYKGNKKSLPEWAEILNIRYQKLYDRLYVLKWDINKAFNTL